MSKSLKKTLNLSPQNADRLQMLCGHLDQNLKTIAQFFSVTIEHNGHRFCLTGLDDSALEKACKGLKQLYAKSESGSLNEKEVHLVLSSIGNIASGKKLSIKTKKNTFSSRGENQQHYINRLMQHTINFGIGPSGTGKTFLAVACAVGALERGEVDRIILTRPIVEAGEKLGFLPGSLEEKTNPYLRPLYDALEESMESGHLQRLIQRGTIEIAPLAYMRGRTLNKAFIILDEGQNTTQEQIKMFITRLGFGSKVVITGDITQIDLPQHQNSGLAHILKITEGIEDIAVTRFRSGDIVRHPLVQAIVQAYQQHEQQSE